MDLFALGKWGTELLERVYRAWSSSKDPSHRQASRVLNAFRAHRVMPHQLPRLLPARLGLSPADVATAASLSAKMCPDVVDWTSETLALRREWLELEDKDPHQRLNWYKQPELLYQWLAGRRAANGGSFAALHVLCEALCSEPDTAHGRFFLVYEEVFAELGDKPLSRYFALSEGMYFEHVPCTKDLMSALTIAEHLGIAARGHVVGASLLAAAEESRLETLLPAVLSRSRTFRLDGWVPLEYRTENCRSLRHAEVFQQVLDDLPKKMRLASAVLHIGST